MRKPGESIVNVLVIIAILAVAALIFYPVINQAIQRGERHRNPSCLSNQRQIILGMQLYAQEHADTMPPAKGWSKAIEVDPRIMRCDQAYDLSIGYAYSSQVAGKKVKQFQQPDAMPVTYDARRGRPEYRHADGLILSFLDGHVEYMKKDKAQPLLATPPIRKD